MLLVPSRKIRFWVVRVLSHSPGIQHIARCAALLASACLHFASLNYLNSASASIVVGFSLCSRMHHVAYCAAWSSLTFVFVVHIACAVVRPAVVAIIVCCRFRELREHRVFPAQPTRPPPRGSTSRAVARRPRTAACWTRVELLARLPRIRRFALAAYFVDFMRRRAVVFRVDRVRCSISAIICDAADISVLGHFLPRVGGRVTKCAVVSDRVRRPSPRVDGRVAQIDPCPRLWSPLFGYPTESPQS